MFKPQAYCQPQGHAMTDTPKIASATPFPIEVAEGKSYFWCSCGQSSKQPFCDGSHKGSSFTPVKWEAPASRTVWFCGCKHSAKAPLCDGAHKSLTIPDGT
jgi:CDGSH-type Zn-finger protein